jgi:hypothetical protein
VKFVMVTMFDQVTDFFKFDQSIIRVVDNKEVHNFNNVVVEVLYFV